MPYERGPLWDDNMPVRPRIVLPATFEALAADFPFIGSSIDQALAGHARDLTPFVNVDIDPTFDATLGDALAGLGALAPASDQAVLSDLHATVDAVVADVTTQTADLPGPDEPDPTTAAPPNDGDPGEPTVGGTVPTAPGFPAQPSPAPGPQPVPAPGPDGSIPPGSGKPTIPLPQPPAPAPAPAPPTGPGTPPDDRSGPQVPVSQGPTLPAPAPAPTPEPPAPDAGGPARERPGRDPFERL